MDIFAAIFGSTLLLFAVGVTYVWGVKPDREKKKRQAEQIRAEQRRQHSERVRRQAELRAGSITNR